MTVTAAMNDDQQNAMNATMIIPVVRILSERTSPLRNGLLIELLA